MTQIPTSNGVAAMEGKSAPGRTCGIWVHLWVKPLRGLSVIGGLLGHPIQAVVAQRPTSIELKPGLVITRSVRILPKTYRLPAPESLDSAAIVIRGDNLTVDLTGVTLLGAEWSADPDQGRGVAIRIEGGTTVRVTGARIRGYQIGVLAVKTRNLVLRDLDASYNWKPRLWSLVEHESLMDWLSFHQNEKREWFRYGAGIYLDEVKGGEVRDNQVTQGMNGLLMVRTDSLLVRDNAFWFNSGLGIGLYRSSDNTIVRNRLDYNVRGYSHGFYHRGQDSAGLLLYEQSSGNLVAWNSVTHGGDGLFLWAGQSTMDSGRGGANDNVFYANDFSFAPANAMEATFSRNRFIANRAEGSDYGVWAGYSYESVIAGNCFTGNRIGIAIEHGQQNLITHNWFQGDTTAISLWANPIEPSDWGYPRHRDTRSRDYGIAANDFVANRVALRVRHTSGLHVLDNTSTRVDSLLVADDSTLRQAVITASEASPSRQSCGPAWVPPPGLAQLVPGLPGIPRAIPTSPAAQRDRSAIVVDEWGPYDWRSPRLWPIDSVRANPIRLRTGGPAGTWKVLERRGIASMTPGSGRTGDTLTVVPVDPGGGNDWEVVLEYRGAATVSPRGVPGVAGAPQRFGYRHWEPGLRWATRFFSWSDSTLPRDPGAFARLTSGTPILTRDLPRLDFQWYRPRIVELPLERWALEATTAVELPAGRYRLRTLSDDGIRVWLDGRLVIDRWSVHESVVDTVPLTGGRHQLTVWYFQDGGWTELRVEMVREP